MAGELRASGLTVGGTYDAFQFNGAGAVWDAVGGSFVVWVDANFANYRSSSQTIGNNGIFYANSVTGAGYYEIRPRAATLAESYVEWADFIYPALLASLSAQTVQTAAILGTNTIISA